LTISGAPGSGYREVECTDLETIVDDLLAGQFNEPVRVLAFNTLEHWSRDLSAEVARQIQTRCDIEGGPIPEHLHDFVGRHAAAAEDIGDGRQMKMQKEKPPRGGFS
jgi:hypothetical protein